MLFNSVFKMTKVGYSHSVRRQLIPEFTAGLRKRLQAMGFDIWNGQTTTFTEPGVVRVNTVCRLCFLRAFPFISLIVLTTGGV